MNNIEWKISDELIDYEDAVAFMDKRVAQIHNGEAKEMVWLLQHPPIYTSGTSAVESDLLSDEFPVYKTGRGGQFTYHGPGQRVAYVMLNLKKRNSEDLRLYVNMLEQWIIETLNYFNIKSERRDGRVGIWVKEKNGGESKIAALGVRVRKWITFHGVAININPDLSHFNGIVPCGISQHGVTSFEELGYTTTMEDFDIVFKEKFFEIFTQQE